ncbi:unnamed protein product [Mycena citricolor]|uniref:RING-type domain-containing protein n=1 Tax=Mycena citricolor TaxID=2018698 RepID=A0AAD2Q5Y6_9AGAR|nr:unnamed protein product [Mycena citricolor]
MGNNSSSGRPQDDSVDYGQLVPQGVYTGPRDWNQSITAQFIIARRLAPFYRPLEDFDESWDDDQILAARKQLPDSDGEQQPSQPPSVPKSSKRPGSLKEPSKAEAALYRGAVECPICFLYYPPNINHSRCCDQAICTECFVQIKRNEPTTTHLVSEPAACPYCVQDNFGIVYTPPPWRAGITPEGSHSNWSESSKSSSPSIETAAPYPTHKRRQKSFSADSAEVVLTDHIRPDWEAKLAAVRAAVARRANRRIIMRQVGDRLIPVGVTSGRVHALSPEEAAAQAENPGTEVSRRSRRRQPGAGNGGMEQFMGMGGQELEELMMMEAMRLSLIEHENQQRKEAEEKKKKEKTESGSTEQQPTAPSTSISAPALAGPGPSTIEARSTSSINLLPSASQAANTLDVNKNPSRSRSPSPSPLQALRDTANGWRRRTSSPPPFSTLTAALSAVSTASAVVTAAGNEQITSMSDSSEVEAPPTLVVSAEPPTTSVEPHVLREESVGPEVAFESETTASSEAVAEQPNLTTVIRPAPPIHQDSMASVLSTTSSVMGGATYDNLPSSPDSDGDSFVAHAPLLGDSPNETTPTKVPQEDAPGYFGGASHGGTQ